MKSDFESLLHVALRPGENRIECPACAANRKTFNRHEKTLAVRNEGDRIIYHCWHCGEKDVLFRASSAAPEYRPQKRLEPTVQKPVTGIYNLNDECYAWLAERGISKETADACNVKRGKVRGTDAIALPYINDKGDATGYKLRSITIPKKEGGFSITGSIGGLFLGHRMDPENDSLVITEGEFDALALREAGVANAVSIPHGAIDPNGRADSTKLVFLSEAEAVLRGKKRIVILTDNDAPGKATGAEIARRVGRWRAYRVNWPEGCKDANDVLSKLGVDTLRSMVERAEAVEIPGIAKPVDFRTDLMRFRNGDVLRGEATGYPGLDQLFKMTPGVLTTITGTPGSGKSELMDQLHVNLAKRLGWTTALWSRENAEFVHTAKLMEKFALRRFHHTQNNCMDDDELEAALQWVNKHFTFLTHDADSSIDSILERMSATVLREGIKMAALDPYNYITKTGDAREDLQVSEMLTKMTDWAKGHEVHIFLVAHPTKLVQPGTIPNGNHISGGANFWNKTDFGLTVHRPGDGLVAEVHCWKSRHSWLGRIGKTDLAFNTNTASYYDPDEYQTNIEDGTVQGDNYFRSYDSEDEL